MAIWLIRAGKYGEFEEKFLTENRVYVTWDKLNRNLGMMKDKAELVGELGRLYPDSPPKRLSTWASQIWPFAHTMKKGDFVVLPSKLQPAIYVGQITGDYKFQKNGPAPFFHWRAVNWIGDAIPRTHFGQDLLYSFGAFSTICRIQRNNAEARLHAMQASGWKPESTAAVVMSEPSDEVAGFLDLEATARDQIARLINAKFKGHGLASLVDAILRAQGYTTRISPEGPDGGVDILAGTGSLGFGNPRLCVQVKSQSDPVDAPTLTQLRGTMTTLKASEGLLVAWGGFKSSVYKVEAQNFFSVRLWTQKELIEALFANYEALEEDLKAELPLKRIWTVAAMEEE